MSHTRAALCKMCDEKEEIKKKYGLQVTNANFHQIKYIIIVIVK